MDATVIVALIGGAATLANVIFTAVFSAIKDHKRKKSADEQALEDGVQCLLRAEIIHAHDKYTARGFCPIYAKESLTRAYTAYHNLGGNDIATDLYNECVSLPNQPREENENEN